MKKMSHLNESEKLLLDKINLTKIEYEKLSKSLGFNSYESCKLFFNRQSKLIFFIHSKYPILKTTSNEKIKSIIQNVLDRTKNKSIKSFMFDDKCSDIFTNCLDQALANYTLNILECTAGAIGIGSVTAGIGGVLFQIACGGAALKNLNLVQSGCRLNYQYCR